MLKKALLASAFSLVSAAASAGDKSATAGYALADSGKTLVVMSDLKKPGSVSKVELKKEVRAIAWRPVTGELLGFANGHVYAIDTKSGKMKDLGASFKEGAKIAADAAVAFDFNNKIDAVRAVSSAGDNLVYFPEGFGDNDERAGSVRRFTDLAYAEGDSMHGKTPGIFANAYTNAIHGKKAGDTFQYALDAETNALVSLANNAGTLATIGQVTVDGKTADLAPLGGFDIVSTKEGDNAGYAILQLEDAKTAGLYKIDLSSGAATLVADLGLSGVTGFAAGKQS